MICIFRLLLFYSIIVMCFLQLNIIHCDNNNNNNNNEHYNSNSNQHQHLHDYPKVNTKWATIIGIRQLIGSRIVNAFLGIPYALPPLGELRFKNPQTISKSHHTGLYYAQKLPNNCLQSIITPNETYSEDCLYLNVWSMQNQFTNQATNQLKPVMIFIHGGAFEMGGSAKRKYYGSYLAAMGDVVLVSINYRLGAFGFLFGNDEEDAPGNVAFYDQRLAMKWVKENIVHFGGDPNKITLFGQSAGSMSIGLHLIVEESRALFERVIMMSGVPVDDAVMEAPDIAIRKSRQLAVLLGCKVNNESSERLTKLEIACLRHAKSEDIIKHQMSLSIISLGYNCGLVPFNPTYGSKFIAYSTNKLMEIGHFKKNVSIMIGNVLNEGSVIDGLWRTSYVNSTKSAIDALRKYAPIAIPPKIVENLDSFLKIYFSDELNARNDYLSLLSDLFFHCPSLIYAKKLAEFNKVNFYYYTYHPKHSANPYGPGHGEEVDYLFGLPFQEQNDYSDDDRFVSGEMIRIWTDFTRNDSLFWPEIVRTKIGIVFPLQYEINPYTKPPKVHPDPGYNKCLFWAEVASIKW